MEYNSSDEAMLQYSNSDTTNRREMPWTDNHEDLLREWQKQCKANSEKHFTKGCRFKRIFALVSFPNIVLPLINSMLLQYYDSAMAYIDVSISIIISLISGILAVMNPGKKSAQHFEYEGKFIQLYNNIDVILSKQKRFREPADVTLEHYRALFNDLILQAPV